MLHLTPCYQAFSVKKKKIGIIPVQATAKRRRLYKMRGNRSAVQGRPRLAQRLSVQLAVDDDDLDGGVVRHKLPTKKQRTCPSSSHNLDQAVTDNRRPSKKH